MQECVQLQLYTTMKQWEPDLLFFFNQKACQAWKYFEVIEFIVNPKYLQESLFAVCLPLVFRHDTYSALLLCEIVRFLKYSS